MHEQEKQELIEKIIESLITNANSKKAVTCWGEPALLLCDVINIINNTAETDYKRYWSYDCRIGYRDCSPHNMNSFCELCKNHFSRKEDKQGCLGTTDKTNQDKPCEKFDSAVNYK